MSDDASKDSNIKSAETAAPETVPPRRRPSSGGELDHPLPRIPVAIEHNTRAKAGLFLCDYVPGFRLTGCRTYY